MFKILSWNIRQGGGSRIAAITQALIAEKPEVIILSEFRNNNSGLAIRNKLMKAGYLHQTVTGASKNDNSVIIASTLPCSSQLHPDADPNYSHNIASISFDAFSVMGMYLPHKKKHQLLSYINDLVKKSDHPFILAGDFNSGKNYIDQKGNSFWYEDQLIQLESNGYHDTFRHIHNDKKEYSWFSYQGNGYRYDHTYAHQSLLPIIKKSYYIHEWRASKWSDHSPMVVILG